MKKIEKKIHTESISLIRNLLEQDSEYYQISSDELKDLLKIADGNIAVTKLPKFKGKPLEVMGNVNLTNLQINNLGNIKKINGNLNISGTNIKDISNVSVSGWVNDSNTPREKERIRKIKQEKLDSAQERKEEDAWNLQKNPNDREALMANVLFDYLIDNGELEFKSEEESERLEEIYSQLKELNKRYDESDEPDEYNQLYDEISNLEEERDQLESKTSSIYNLIPKNYNFYGLKTFEIVDESDSKEEVVYTVGDESEMDEAILEYSKNLIDELGTDAFNESFIESHIDEDMVEQYVRDTYYDDIVNNPDVYFSEEDFELSPKQEERVGELEKYIEELENYIEELENYIDDLTTQQNNLEDEIEDPQEYSEKYDEIQKLIDDAETKKDEAQEEIDQMEPDQEPTEDMIEEKLDEIVEDKKRYPVDFIKEHGYDLTDFIDIDELAKALAVSDGYGAMNSLNGDYDTVGFDDETYYIMRIQ